MSRELRSITVAFTVHSSEHLPMGPAGGQMYADDVAEELGDVINQAVAVWYQARGKDLLACDPST